MRIAVLWKRYYMNQDLILDRYARLYELPRGLASLGHRVLGICLSYRPSQAGRFPDPGLPPEALEWIGLNAGPWLIGGLPGYWKQTMEQLRDFAPDLLLGGSDAPHAIITQVMARRLHRPYVLDLYDNYESFGLTKIPGLRPLYRRALRQAGGIVSVSEPLSEYVGGLAPEVPGLTLESTINPALFQPHEKTAARRRLGLPLAARLIGAAGSLHRSRGIGLLYRAFARLAALDPSLHLVLVGSPDPRLPPPKGERILFLGRLPHPEMAWFFSALDVAALPMIDTPFGRYAFPQKAYEILACGTPLVTARLGALARTLKDAPRCLYTPGDEADLAWRLRDQLEAPYRPERRIPTWQEQAECLSAFLEGIAAVPKR